MAYCKYVHVLPGEDPTGKKTGAEQAAELLKNLKEGTATDEENLALRKALGLDEAGGKGARAGGGGAATGTNGGSADPLDGEIVSGALTELSDLLDAQRDRNSGGGGGDKRGKGGGGGKWNSGWQQKKKWDDNNSGWKNSSSWGNDKKSWNNDQGGNWKNDDNRGKGNGEHHGGKGGGKGGDGGNYHKRAQDKDLDEQLEKRRRRFEGF